MLCILQVELQCIFSGITVHFPWFYTVIISGIFALCIVDSVHQQLQFCSILVLRVLFSCVVRCHQIGPFPLVVSLATPVVCGFEKLGVSTRLKFAVWSCFRSEGQKEQGT